MRWSSAPARGVHVVEHEIEIPSSGMAIDVLVEIDYTPGDPGNVFGLPENCWPEEPATIDIIKVVGKESGLCCMDLLERERVPLMFIPRGWPHKTQSLLAHLRDDMHDRASDLFD